MPQVWIDNLTFSDGSNIKFASSDVVIVVGPNNSGKSVTLRAIRDKLAADAQSPVVAQLASLRLGDSQGVVDWLESFAKVSEQNVGDRVFDASGASFSRSQLDTWWKGQHPLYGLARIFCHVVTTEERLQAANSPPNIAMLSQAPSHPIHYLLRDAELEKRISDHFRTAFGVDLIVNRLGGNVVPLHVGARPIPAPGQDRLSKEYIEKLESLPLLQAQVDGMRAFVGVLLHTSVGKETILLIDEPEAFLHPPQARQLGRMLVADKATDRQLFLATHSGDLLRGVLDAGSLNVRVIRIRRVGNVNHVREIDNKNLAELWKDPLLRYSNILDGIFHEKVIVCEGDADARFYAAVSDAVSDAQGEQAKRPDVMFTHCGGKDRVSVVVRALRAVDVPIVAVLDFDVLSKEYPLRDIVVACGGEWSRIEPDWKQVKAAIDSKKAELNVADVKTEIAKVLQTVSSTPVFTTEARDAIQAIIKRASPWAIAKATGSAFVPSGQPTQAYKRLDGTLAGLGIFVVAVGELERFVPSVGNHGPKWVNEALKRNLGSDDELEAARKFVARFIAHR